MEEKVSADDGGGEETLREAAEAAAAAIANLGTNTGAFTASGEIVTIGELLRGVGEAGLDEGKMEYSKLARDIRWWYRVGRLSRESIGVILVSLSGQGWHRWRTGGW